MRSSQPTRAAAALLLLALLLPTACDRNNHPDQLGRPAPPVLLRNGAQTLDLASLRGHVVLLNFWASWCAPCLVEMPSLIALQQQLPQVKVILIAFDEDPATYNAYLSRHPLPLFTILDTTGQAHTSFGTFRPPETYILDQHGTIRRKFIGTQDWTSPEILATLQKLSEAGS